MGRAITNAPVAAVTGTIRRGFDQSEVRRARGQKLQKLRIADVAGAFDTYTPFTTTTALAGHGTVPLAVAKICELTWMCAPAPRGPNIHGNASGYQTMARVFAHVL